MCGNSIVDTGEECDDGNTTGGDACGSTCQCDGHFAGPACDNCDPGYFGAACTSQCPGGAANPCNAHGTCDDGIAGSGTCTCTGNFVGAACDDCAAGYFGAACTSQCPGGAANPCNAHGTCDDGIAGSGTCQCDPGYGPPQCLPLTPPTAIDSYPHGARKQRYISFLPDAGHTAHAYQVTAVGATGIHSGVWYNVSTPRTTPAAIAGEGLTFIVNDSSPIIFDWTTTPQVHVGGCLIAPGTDSGPAGVGREYRVRATTDGVNFSSELALFTAARPTAANARFWADIVGYFTTSGDGTTTPPTPANSWTPPDRLVSGSDISAALQGASGALMAPHFTWGDVNPELTDRVASGPDTLRVTNAFTVGSGKEYYPFAYPVTPSPIHHPTTPPSPALCPAPPLMSALNP